MIKSHSERGGVLAGVLAAFLILAALAVIGIFFAGMYVADNIHVKKSRGANGETVQVDTPIGSMRVQEHKKLDPKLIGVPVYPGALREDSDGGAASFDFSYDEAHRQFSVLAAKYTTDDPVDKVRDFYHRELPHWMFTEKHDGGFQMEYTEQGYKRFVVIKREHGQTCIGLASVGQPASN